MDDLLQQEIAVAVLRRVGAKIGQVASHLPMNRRALQMSRFCGIPEAVS
jgi:hypothetical protein